MNKSFWTCIAAVALLSACSNDEVVSVQTHDTNAISFNTAVDKSVYVSRATDITSNNLGTYGNGFSVYSYTDGDDDDEATPYVTIDDKSWYQLLTDEHVTGSGIGDNGNWNYTHIQYWKAGNNYHFHAIAPYGSDETTDGTPTAVDDADETTTTATALTEEEMATKRHWEYIEDQTNFANATIKFTNIEAGVANGTQDLVYSYQKAVGKAKDNDKVNYTFSHLLSRVKFKFVGAETNPASVNIQVSDVRITNTYDKGSITIENEGASSKSSIESANWNFDEATQSTLSFGPTINDNDGSFTTGSAETDHKYVIPVNAETSYTADIDYVLTAKIKEDLASTYKVSKTGIALPAVKMRKGFSYVYVISVKTGGTNDTNNLIDPIIFSVSVVEEWDGTSTGNGITDPIEISFVGDIYDKAMVKQYDYAMDDGSFVSHDATLTDKQLEHLAGIVYWVNDNNETLDDEALTAAGYTHGLIMALKDYSEEQEVTTTDEEGHESTTTETVSTFHWQNTSIELGSIYPQIQLTNVQNGYSSTLCYKDYNQSDVVAKNSKKLVIPVAKLDNIKNIATTSGWYIPSYKDFDTINGSDLKSINALNSKLSALGDKATAIGSENDTLFTSTERQYNNQFMMRYTVTDGTITKTEIVYLALFKDKYAAAFRPICAF